MADDDGLSVSGPETLGGALVFLLVGLAVTGYGVYDYTQQSDTLANAVEVDATVTEVGVETTTDPGSNDVEYEPRVRFTYRFEGTTYNGADLFPAGTTPAYDTESEAREAVAPYETDETVTAYVVPDDPDDAFLRNERSNTPLTLAGVGGVVSLLGGVLTVKRYRET